jgi:hypothetical protein
VRPLGYELGLSAAVKLLEATLREEKATDEALTKIAETVANQDQRPSAAEDHRHKGAGRTLDTEIHRADTAM